MQNNIKIALIGNAGTGKDTFVKFLRDAPHLAGFQQIKLARILYIVQEFIYKMCGKSKDFNSQDGELLNFLDEHMRKINPNMMKDYFLEQLVKLRNISPVIICSDGRPADVPFLKDHDFIIVYISTNQHLSQDRRIKRGDVYLGNPNHPTEENDKNIVVDYHIENNGTIEAYQAKVFDLIQEIYDSHWRRNQAAG